MAEQIRDGERLPMVGGPRDGSTHPAERLLPFLDGGILPAGVSFGDHFYRLDQDARRWVYQCKKESDHG